MSREAIVVSGISLSYHACMENQPLNESSSEARRRLRGRRAGKPGEAFMDLGESGVYVDFSGVREVFRSLGLIDDLKKLKTPERPLEEWD